ncbi:MAG: EAL domain-containing protein [Acidimicrobiia bacterium]|nr:EAL domain-containing protein [Acidimicrobiia bacterium]
MSEPERRLSTERLIWRFRFWACAFTAVQTAVRTGDDPRISWAFVVLFAASVGVSRHILAGEPSDATVRRVGVAAMALDVAIVSGTLFNNLTDPAEPIYMITVLLTLEAAVRWRFRGGALAGLMSGLAAGMWTWAVYERTGLPFVSDYATMRLGVLTVLGFFIGSIVERVNDERRTLQQTLDVSRDLIVSLDRKGTILTVNAACIDLLGYEPSELIDRSYHDFVQGGDRSAPGSSIFDGIPQRESAILADRRFRCADGSSRWLELHLTRVDDGSVVYAVGRDVTERRAAARRLLVSEQRFRSLFDHSADAVYSFDLDGRFTSANPATLQMTGYSLDELGEMGFAPLIEPGHLDDTRARFEQAAAGIAQSYDMVLRTRDGRLIDLHVTNLPIVVDGTVVGVYGVAKDVTDRRRLERQLGFQARHDALTGLPNRVVLDELLRLVVEDRRGSGVALLFVDLDRFKVVNDSRGHHHGDELLVAVVGRLQSCLRTGDVLVRWAGDEFCAVLPGTGRAETAVAVAKRMLTSLEAPVELAGREVHVSASIGVAVAYGPDQVDGLLLQADQAMYEAKRAGRARISVYAAGGAVRERSQLDVEVELRRAIERAELSLVYQPVVEVATGHIVGFESLVRWPRPDGTCLPPAEFVPLAERTGLIRGLTRWSLGEACRQLAAWDDVAAVAVGRTVRPLTMGVNVSAVDLGAPALVDEVACALAVSGIAPCRLVLEVTETMLIADPAAVQPIVEGLRALGVLLAIDDFGVGYSSLSQLQHLPVSLIKVDSAFMAGVEPGSRGAAIAASLIGISDAFGIPFVAEGVENVAQMEVLVAAGFPYAQGFLFARPGTPDEVLPLVRARQVALPAATGAAAGVPVGLGAGRP